MHISAMGTHLKSILVLGNALPLLLGSILAVDDPVKVLKDGGDRSCFLFLRFDFFYCNEIFLKGWTFQSMKVLLYFTSLHKMCSFIEALWQRFWRIFVFIWQRYVARTNKNWWTNFYNIRIRLLQKWVTLLTPFPYSCYFKIILGKQKQILIFDLKILRILRNLAKDELDDPDQPANPEMSANLDTKGMPSHQVRSIGYLHKTKKSHPDKNFAANGWTVSKPAATKSPWTRQTHSRMKWRTTQKTLQRKKASTGAYCANRVCKIRSNLQILFSASTQHSWKTRFWDEKKLGRIFPTKCLSKMPSFDGSCTELGLRLSSRR